jgi:glycosyltransferase involved in cell wall biosynthesis
MKVLIQNRPDAFKVFGGDSVQVLKTAEYLRRRNVNVDISLELTPDLSGYDIVHLMNITRVTFTYAQLMNAKRQGKKTVLSPIYWNTKSVMSSYLQTPFLGAGISSWKELGKACFTSLAGRTLFNETMEFVRNRSFASKVLSEVDCILPNSKAELEILQRDFPKIFQSKKKENAIVPNGVDAEIFYKASSKKFTERFKTSDFVLNVGRFSYRKNQLAMIKALKDVGLRVVFIGGSEASSNYYGIKDAIDKLYYQECIRASNSSFTFLPPLPHQDIAAAYAACRVFVLPSLYETPGLSALEAALAGANICITSGGSTREYFSDYAFYCNPNSANSIRNAVLNAFNAPKNTNLQQHVLRNFTWEKTAEVTLQAYEKVLSA